MPGVNPRPHDPLFDGPGDVRALCRSIDWAATPLGPAGEWSQGLRLVVRLCLESKTPMALWIGPSFTLLHNDAYAAVLARRYPDALGRPLREVWPEAWDQVRADVERVFYEGLSLRHDEAKFRLLREGYEDDAYFAYSLTPVRDVDGSVLGVLNVMEETTRLVRAREGRERKYQTLFGSIDEALCLVEPMVDAHGKPVDYRFLETNPAFAHHTGYEDAVGKTARQLNPRLEPLWPETVHRVATTAEPVHVEGRVQNLDRWYEVFAFKVEADPADPGAKVGLLFRDITQRKQAEEELRRAAARHEEQVRLFESVASTTPDLVYVFDRDGRLVYANRRLLEVWGVTLAEALGKTFRELGYEQWHHDMHTREIAQVTATQRPIKGEMPFKAPLTGIFGVYEYIFTPVLGPSREIVLIAGTACDVTERKRGEDALRESEAGLEGALRQAEQRAAEIDAILHAMPHAVFFGTAEGITRCNAEALRVLGASSVQDLQHRIDELGRKFRVRYERDREGRAVKPEDLPFNRALSGEVAALDTWVTRADTSEDVLIRGYAAPVSVDGQTIGAVAVNIDITDQFLLREEIVAAKERLEEEDRRKDHFLAVLSHELRNPLTPIKNSLYVLDRAVPGGDQARRSKDVIERQVDQLSHLVDDLLDVTRITRGKIQLQRRRLELNELARRTLDDHRAVFENAGVRVELEAAPQPVFVEADWSRVAQILSNLLQNSAKFTPPGGRVTVTVARELATRMALLRVADTGVGMTRDLLDRLFQPFMQADETLDRTRGGLGLGLALVKGLVELHGGVVQAASAGPNLGSEFVVRLPLDLDAPAAVERPQARSEGAQRRVLIIEDNVDAAESLRDLLELQGHAVAVAHGGPEGLAMAREVKPDLVLCDIGLPGMDGYEVARAFRRDDGLREVRLIALSGYALPDDLQRAAEAGFEDHIAKPPSLERLGAVLEARAASR